MDGAKFLAEAGRGTFDLVIVDGIDFQEGAEFEYGQVLFDPNFYENAYRALGPEGVFAQYASGAEEAPYRPSWRTNTPSSNKLTRTRPAS